MFARLLALSTIVLLPPAAAAPPERLIASFGVQYQHFEYEENHDGNRLNKEDGELPGLELRLEEYRGQWYARAWGRYADGEVDYDGQTNAGAPLNTDTDETIWHGHLGLGRWLTSPDSFLDLGLQAGGGYRHWERDIQSTSTVLGLEETYRWPYLSAGATALKTRGAATWSLEAELLWPINPEVEIDDNPVFNKTELDLEQQLGGRLALRWHQDLNPRLGLALELWYEHWELGQSDTETINAKGGGTLSIFEPDSDTDIIGVTLSLGWQLPGGLP